MVKVTDNFLPPELFSQVQTTLLSQQMDAWRLCPILTESGKDEPYNSQMVMDCMSYGSIRDMMDSVLNQLDSLCWLRVKANITFRTEKHRQNPYHVDVNDEIRIPNHTFTGILYLNTCNGYTEFEDGSRVECVENRYAEFDASKLHAGVTTTDTDYKALININYVRKESLWQ